MENIEVIETPETDALAIFREQVKVESANKAGMSEAAASKLRALTESDRLDKIDGGRFCTALKSVIVTHENLGKLIQRCHTSTPVEDIERRVHKLNYFITAGYELGREIDSVSAINFLSELTQDETFMGDSGAMYSRASMTIFLRIQSRSVGCPVLVS